MKYLSLLILIVLSTTISCAGHDKALPELKPSKETQRLQDAATSTQKELAAQKTLLEDQQKQITSLENPKIVPKPELPPEITTLAQSAEKVQKEIAKTEQSIKNLRRKLSRLNTKAEQRSKLIEQQAAAIGILKKAFGEQQAKQNTLLQQQSEKIDFLESTLNTSTTEYNKQVENSNQGVAEAKAQLNTLGQSLGGKLNQIGYWVGFAVLLGLLGIALGIIVRKKLARSSDQLEDNLSRMRTQMEEENVKLDSKLVELLQSQMKLVQEQPSSPAVPVPAEAEIDHSLPLRVGAEILRLRQRIKKLPDGTKGTRSMFKSLERLEDEFNERGYELVEMLGKPFDDRLNAKARFIPSDDIGVDERIISKIIKPQINFNGVSIQVAEIEVITGEE